MSARFFTTMFIHTDINSKYIVRQHGLSKLYLFTPKSVMMILYVSMVYLNGIEYYYIVCITTRHSTSTRIQIGIMLCRAVSGKIDSRWSSGQL